jgi:hypothetical protein
MDVEIEEKLDRAMDIMKNEEDKALKSSRFLDLEKLIKDTIDKFQDSEKALVLITK